MIELVSLCIRGQLRTVEEEITTTDEDKLLGAIFNDDDHKCMIISKTQLGTKESGSTGDHLLVNADKEGREAELILNDVRVDTSKGSKPLSLEIGHNGEISLIYTNQLCVTFSGAHAKRFLEECADLVKTLLILRPDINSISNDLSVKDPEKKKEE